MYVIVLIKVLPNQANQENLVHHVSKTHLHKRLSAFCNFSLKQTVTGVRNLLDSPSETQS